jgi:hypothetical protein
MSKKAKSKKSKPVETPISTATYPPISMQRNFFKAHPWHGIQIGADMPKIVTAFIEIVPTDTVKYEN